MIWSECQIVAGLHALLAMLEPMRKWGMKIEEGCELQRNQCFRKVRIRSVWILGTWSSFTSDDLLLGIHSGRTWTTMTRCNNCFPEFGLKKHAYTSTWSADVVMHTLYTGAGVTIFSQVQIVQMVIFPWRDSWIFLYVPKCEQSRCVRKPAWSWRIWDVLIINAGALLCRWSLILQTLPSLFVNQKQSYPTFPVSVSDIDKWILKYPWMRMCLLLLINYSYNQSIFWIFPAWCFYQGNRSAFSSAWHTPWTWISWTAFPQTSCSKVGVMHWNPIVWFCLDTGCVLVVAWCKLTTFYCIAVHFLLHLNVVYVDCKMIWQQGEKFFSCECPICYIKDLRSNFM